MKRTIGLIALVCGLSASQGCVAKRQTAKGTEWNLRWPISLSPGQCVPTKVGPSGGIGEHTHSPANATGNPGEKFKP